MAKNSGEAFDRTFSAEINGILTNFVFKRFTNKIFLIVTQNAKMGNLFTVRFEAEQAESQLFGDGSQTTVPLHIIHNFGEDTDEVRSAVQFIINNSKLKRSALEIMVSVGLKQIDGNCLKQIVKILDTVL